jgi:hypothetical protein
VALRPARRCISSRHRADDHDRTWWRRTRRSSFALAEVTNVGTPSSVDQDVLSINSDLAEMCSGWPGDDPHIDEVCAVRLKVEKLLGSLGYCFGKEGQSRAESVWHKCTAQSSYRP